MGIRPIVSSCDSITEKISQFVDKWLQPYIKNLPSYVKDTTEFINHIEATQLPTNCKLASIDVSSLCTNIPYEEGVQSALHFLKSNSDTYKHPEQPNPEILGELMSLVLKHNVFEFDEKFYLQIQGTAMGTKMAPVYANLFMGRLEAQLINQAPESIHSWKRFITLYFMKTPPILLTCLYPHLFQILSTPIPTLCAAFFSLAECVTMSDLMCCFP